MDKLKRKKLGIYLEGLESYIYNDSTGKQVKLSDGKLTGGIGHNFEAKPLSDRVIDEIFNEDADEIENGLRKALPFYDELDEVREAAILFTAFQIGVHGFLAFTDTINDLKNKLYQNAALDLLNSVVARKYPQRYQILSKMLITGIWPNV